jgi:hypothetical protein
MKLFHRNTLAAAALAAALLATLPVQAGPGAHGPNGEHLDGPAAAQAPTNAVPRLETHSEAFELVATLAGGELSLLIDRYETNEPVLNATVEIEFEGHSAKAKFHDDHGDYAVADEAFLKALSAPGEHALVFTITAGDQADLLDGVLKVTAEGAAAAEGHGHSHDHATSSADDQGHAGDHGGTPRWTWAAGIVAALGAVAGGGLVLRRRAQRNGRPA